MPLDPHEVSSLYLSATIRIPHIPPATGDVYLIRHKTPGNANQDFLRVVDEVHESLRFTYLLRLTDVRAIRLEPEPEKPPASKSPKQGGETPAATRKKKGSAPLGERPPRILTTEHLIYLAGKTPLKAPQEEELWIPDAAVFVPEGAPVHVQAHAGLSAAESAQFHPRMFSLRAAISRCDPNPHTHP
jgi:hypothetical protein